MPMNEKALEKLAEMWRSRERTYRDAAQAAERNGYITAASRTEARADEVAAMITELEFVASGGPDAQAELAEAEKELRDATDAYFVALYRHRGARAAVLKEKP